MTKRNHRRGVAAMCTSKVAYVTFQEAKDILGASVTGLYQCPVCEMVHATTQGFGQVPVAPKAKPAPIRRETQAERIARIQLEVAETEERKTRNREENEARARANKERKQAAKEAAK